MSNGNHTWKVLLSNRSCRIWSSKANRQSKTNLKRHGTLEDRVVLLLRLWDSRWVTVRKVPVSSIKALKIAIKRNQLCKVPLPRIKLRMLMPLKLTIMLTSRKAVPTFSSSRSLLNPSLIGAKADSKMEMSLLRSKSSQVFQYKLSWKIQLRRSASMLNVVQLKKPNRQRERIKARVRIKEKIITETDLRQIESKTNIINLKLR